MSDTPASDSPAPKPRKERRTAFRAAAVVAVVVAAVVGGRYYLHSRAYESTDDAFLEAHIVPVSARVAGHVLKVLVQDNQDVKKGDVLVELDPRDFQVRLEEARARLGVAEARQQAARKGADLVRVTSGAGVDEASAAVSRTRSGVETARAQLEAAKSRVDQSAAQRAAAEAVAEQLQAEVTAAETDAARADADAKRYQEAARSRGVSRQQLDLAEASATSARARLSAAQKRAAAGRAQAAEAKAGERTAQENLKQANAQLGEAIARVGEAKGRLSSAEGAPHQVAASVSQAHAASAEVELARAAVRQAELDLSYTKVLASEDGRVARKGVEPGAFVQPGQGLMALVTPELWVVANFKETQLTRMRVGQAAVLHIDAYPDRSFRGRVQSLQAGAGARFSVLPPENATGNYVKVVQRVPVKIVFDEAIPPELHLGPGMSVEPEVRVR